MKKHQVVLGVLFFFLVSTHFIKAQKTISFFSKDGVLITADLYLLNDTLPYMILCHQAGSSRGEYLETASRFTKFGYNCLAIDARSGGKINNVKNETAIRAKAKQRSTKYLDAEQDIKSAIDYAVDLSNKKVVLVGSTYSASLAMKIARDDFNVKAVIGFSPADYFGKNYNLKDSIKTLKTPLFVTSSSAEAPDLGKLIAEVASDKKQQFTPSKAGSHGSRALWKVTPNHREYWTALMMFMIGLN